MVKYVKGITRKEIQSSTTWYFPVKLCRSTLSYRRGMFSIPLFRLETNTFSYQHRNNLEKGIIKLRNNYISVMKADFEFYSNTNWTHDTFNWICSAFSRNMRINSTFNCDCRYLFKFKVFWCIIVYIQGFPDDVSYIGISETRRDKKMFKSGFSYFLRV